MVPEKNLGTGIGKIWYRKSTGIGIKNIWYRKKVSVSVSAKLGTRKSTCIGIENIWYRKKYRYRYRSTFWVPSHTILQAWNLFGFLMYQLVTFQRRHQVEFFATYFTVFQLPTYMRVLVGRQITTSNLLGHSVHENGLSFVWNLIWICRFPFWWNPFPQWVHVNFFSLHHHELGCASLSLML